MANKRGYTLIELMITVALIAIVLTLAVPEFRTLLQNNRSITTASNLKASMQHARSEALKRGTFVSLCPQARNFTACGSDWTQGWIVFTNPDENTSFSGSEVLIRTYPATDTSMNFSFNQSSTLITFRPNGMAATVSSGQQITVDATGCVGPARRVISVSATGRVDISEADCP